MVEIAARDAGGSYPLELGSGQGTRLLFLNVTETSYLVKSLEKA